jgi:hypothetical protein
VDEGSRCVVLTPVITYPGLIIVGGRVDSQWLQAPTYTTSGVQAGGLGVVHCNCQERGKLKLEISPVPLSIARSWRGMQLGLAHTGLGGFGIYVFRASHN